MSASAEILAAVTGLAPKEAARRLIETQQDNTDWLDAFAEHLDRHRAGQALERILAVWDLSQSAAARLFGVSRQAISQWINKGPPAERAEVIADVAAATDLLVHYLKRDRIPAVVRRPIPACNNQSLLDLLESGENNRLLEVCRDMFGFDQAHT